MGISTSNSGSRGKKVMHPTAIPKGGGPTIRTQHVLDPLAGRDPASAAKAPPTPLHSPFDVANRHWNVEGANISDSLKRALEVCEAAFDAIVDKSDDGVIVVDQQGTICFTNAAAESMLGRSTGELLGERFAIPVVPGKIGRYRPLEEGRPAADCGDARRFDFVGRETPRTWRPCATSPSGSRPRIKPAKRSAAATSFSPSSRTNCATPWPPFPTPSPCSAAASSTAGRLKRRAA